MAHTEWRILEVDANGDVDPGNTYPRAADALAALEGYRVRRGYLLTVEGMRDYADGARAFRRTGVVKGDAAHPAAATWQVKDATWYEAGDEPDFHYPHVTQQLTGIPSMGIDRVPVSLYRIGVRQQRRMQLDGDSTMRVTLNNVNKALAAAGHSDVELVRGNGYFYFAGERAAALHSSSVYVFHLGDLTVAEWVAEYTQRAAEVA